MKKVHTGGTGNISIEDAAEIVDRPYQTTLAWYNTGLRTLSQLKHKANGTRRGRGKGTYTPPVFKKCDEDFDRKSFCNRLKINERCKHKKGCQEYRLKHGKQPPRFEEDGSCYDGEMCECGSPTYVTGFQMKHIENQKGGKV
jgi:hypothetical protein